MRINSTSKRKKEYELKESLYSLKNQIDSIDKIKNDLEIAEDTLSLSCKKLESSYKNGSMSSLELQELKDTVNLNKKKASELTASLKNETGEANKKEIIEQKIKTLNLELNSLNDFLGYVNFWGDSIRSPFENCVIEGIYCSEGDVVDSQLKIISLINLDSIMIQAEVPEENIKDVKIGAKVKIIPVTDKNLKFYGYVKKISNIAYYSNFNTYFSAEICVADKGRILLPNANVDLEIYKHETYESDK